MTKEFPKSENAKIKMNLLNESLVKICRLDKISQQINYIGKKKKQNKTEKTNKTRYLRKHNVNKNTSV